MRGGKLEILEPDVVLMFLNNTQNPLFIVFSLFFVPFFIVLRQLYLTPTKISEHQ